jgi:hypothetical protein
MLNSCTPRTLNSGRYILRIRTLRIYGNRGTSSQSSTSATLVTSLVLLNGFVTRITNNNKITKNKSNIIILFCDRF